MLSDTFYTPLTVPADDPVGSWTMRGFAAGNVAAAVGCAAIRAAPWTYAGALLNAGMQYHASSHPGFFVPSGLLIAWSASGVVWQAPRGLIAAPLPLVAFRAAEFVAMATLAYRGWAGSYEYLPKAEMEARRVAFAAQTLEEEEAAAAAESRALRAYLGNAAAQAAASVKGKSEA